MPVTVTVLGTRNRCDTTRRRSGAVSHGRKPPAPVLTFEDVTELRGLIYRKRCNSAELWVCGDGMLI
jgi:hypothetical protein